MIELFSNPDSRTFEGGTIVGWTNWFNSVLSVDAAEFHSGSKSMKVVSTGAASGILYTSIPIPAGAQKATFDFWMKANRTQGIHQYFSQRAPSGDILYNLGQTTITADGAWHNYRAVSLAPAKLYGTSGMDAGTVQTCTVFDFYMHLHASVLDDIFWYDDLTCQIDDGFVKVWNGTMWVPRQMKTY